MILNSLKLKKKIHTQKLAFNLCENLKSFLFCQKKGRTKPIKTH